LTFWKDSFPLTQRLAARHQYQLNAGSVKMKKTLTVSAAILALAAATSVQAAQPTGPYFGALIGETKIKEAEIDLSEKEITWGAFVGYQFLPYLGAELAYYKPQKMVFRDEGSDDGIWLGTNAWAASIIGTLPLGETFSFHARVGAARAKASATVRFNGVEGSDSVSSTDLIYGGGVGLMLEGARVRLEYQRLDAGGTKLGLLNLGIVWFPVRTN
jgi:hypothetical protein